MTHHPEVRGSDEGTSLVDSRSTHAKYPGWVQIAAVVGGSALLWGLIALVGLALRALHEAL